MNFYAINARFLMAAGLSLVFASQQARAQCPVAANCNPTGPSGTNLSFGIGIQNVTLGSLNHSTPVNSTGGGQNGYQNYSCTTGATLTASVLYPISITTGPNTTENVRVYIDYNNDGVFTLPAELAFSSNSATTHTGNITVPGTAVSNTPLRMRVVSEFTGASALPSPCMALQYGQAEDYFIIVQPNTQPALPDFNTSEVFTCDGTVSFTDLSQNAPTSWAWDFGDPGSGLANTSAQQNPSHTFSSAGTYNITLMACNVNGCSTIVKNNYITYNADLPVAATCTPATLNYCCGYGIYNVSFAGINNSSADGIAGYQDFTCPVRATLVEGLTYPISISTSAGNNQNTSAWIDFNNDGAFSATENIFTSLNSINPSGNVTIPTGAVLNTPLRMRVISDFAGGTISACGNPQNGQAEDYTVTIVPNTFPPVPNFTIAAFAICDTVRQFTNTTQINPTSPATTYLWNFGDGNTSTAQNPSHTYSTSAGNYSVSLIACNSFGCDTTTVANAVTISNPCLNYCIPANNDNTLQWISKVETGAINNASGAGPGGFSDFTNLSTSIVRGTPASFTVSLGANFQRVISIWIDYNRNGNFEFGERIINNQSGFLPNGSRGLAGTFTIPVGAQFGPTRMRIIARDMNNTVNACISNTFNTDIEDYTIILQSPPPVTPAADFAANQSGICSGIISFEDFSTNFPTSWAWDFGDGSPVVTTQNPSHTYQFSTPASYTVTLIACNAAGCDTITMPDLVVITVPCTIPICPSDGHNNSVQHITSVTLGTLSNTSGAAANGYSDFTTVPTTEVLIGAQTGLSVLLSGSTQLWQIAAWIDYNHNSTYETNERLFFGATSVQGSGGYGRTGNFTVPAGALPGPALMRIIGRQGVNTDPCAVNLSSAETEDYIINLVTQASHNVGVESITSPGSGCTLSSSSVVCISVRNFGTQTQSNIPVRFTVGTIQSPVEFIPGPLAPDSVVNFCFTTTANLATTGTYNLLAQTLLAGDAGEANNSQNFLVSSFPLPNSNFTYTANGLELTFSANNPNGATYSWDFGNGSSSALTNPVHTFSGNGSFIVSLSVVSGNGCESTTTQTIGVSGTGDFHDHQVSIYPNPTAGMVTIELPEADGVSLEILNSLGQMILEKTNLENYNQTDLSSFSKGVYYLKLKSDTTLTIRKLVLE